MTEELESSAAVSLNVTLAENPINEFDDNNWLISAVLPHLVLLGKGVPVCGTLPA